ncbi:MAG: hypothetical protein ACI8RZ_005521 [Myxococcota bacterium]|jgi:uncharacterized protein involved in type VI secretion and phage assembly
MINGLVVGTVLDNKDPDGLHRIKIQYPVESEDQLDSSWCRMCSPMAGKDRGLVILPDIGTEVVIVFAYRSMTPYIVGAVYNGAEDKPESYHNDDGNNDKRVFWSRNDHMVIFDDTSGAEKVEIGAQATTRLDIKSAPIYQSMDSAEKTITMFCEKDSEVEALETISIKCKDFKLEADQTIKLDAGQTGIFKAVSSASIVSTGTQTYKATAIGINPSAPTADPERPLDTPPHSHPPTS